jgi:tetratricopeptide (TPR) repeat protein
VNIAALEEKLKSSRENKDIHGELSALRQLGSFYQESRQLTKAASCLSKVLTLVDKTGNERDQAVAFAKLGCVYWEMAQLKKAMTHFQEALKIQQQIEDFIGQKAVLTLLGISYWRKCEWEEGLSYFRKTLELQKTHKPNPDEQSNDDAYASLFEALERGVQTLKNRVRLGREQNDPLKILQPLFSMIPLYLFTGRGGEVELLLHEAGSLAKALHKKDIMDMILKLDGFIRNFY